MTPQLTLGSGAKPVTSVTDQVALYNSRLSGPPGISDSEVGVAGDQIPIGRRPAADLRSGTLDERHRWSSVEPPNPQHRCQYGCRRPRRCRPSLAMCTPVAVKFDSTRSRTTEPSDPSAKWKPPVTVDPPSHDHDDGTVQSGGRRRRVGDMTGLAGPVDRDRRRHIWKQRTNGDGPRAVAGAVAAVGGWGCRRRPR